MSRTVTMSRFAEPGNEPEAYLCEQCDQIKDAKEFTDEYSPMCMECEENKMNEIETFWDHAERGAIEQLVHAAKVPPDVANQPWSRLSADVQAKLKEAHGKQ